ncbi:MAG TPA: hypothetical protein VNL98_03850 [Gemmatimonadales bacterium]|nr:hypothetical protein [Gemmatimonadales bacterium]
MSTDRSNVSTALLPHGDIRRLTTTTDALPDGRHWTPDGPSLVIARARVTTRMLSAYVGRLLTSPHPAAGAASQ